MKGNCFSCKHLTQTVKDKSHFICGHKDAIKGSVVNNFGRGFYCYHNFYDQCDIDKYQPLNIGKQ